MGGNLKVWRKYPKNRYESLSKSANLRKTRRRKLSPQETPSGGGKDTYYLNRKMASDTDRVSNYVPLMAFSMSM